MEESIDQKPHPLVDAMLKSASRGPDGYTFAPAVVDVFVAAVLDPRFQGPELMAIWYSGTRAVVMLQESGHASAARVLTEALAAVALRLQHSARQDASKARKREDSARTTAKTLGPGMVESPAGLTAPKLAVRRATQTGGNK